MVVVSLPPSGEDAVRCISLTAGESETGSYCSPNIQKALEAMHQDGLVILKSVVDNKHIDLLNQDMSKEAETLIRNKVKPFNQGVECLYRSIPCKPS